MTNPASTRRAPATNRRNTPRAAARRRRFARVLPAAACLSACLLLGAAAAVDGGIAALVLALWVSMLVVAGVWMTEPRRLHPLTSRRPVLVLAELNEDLELGRTRTLPVVASPEAIAVLDSRPRG